MSFFALFFCYSLFMVKIHFLSFLIRAREFNWENSKNIFFFIKFFSLKRKIERVLRKSDGRNVFFSPFFKMCLIPFFFLQSQTSCFTQNYFFLNSHISGLKSTWMRLHGNLLFIHSSTTRELMSVIHSGIKYCSKKSRKIHVCTKLMVWTAVFPFLSSR